MVLLIHLDEIQIMVNLFKDKGVRIILRKEENEFGRMTFVAYFHAWDIAQNIKYDEKNISQWKTRWNINYINYKKTFLHFEGTFFSNFDNCNTDKSIIFE